MEATRTTVRNAITLTSTQITNIAALLRMEDSRMLDTLLIRKLITDPSAEIRGRAALAAGRVGDRAASPLLRLAAGDRVDDVAADAAFAMGELGDTASASLALLHAMMFRPAGGAAAREATHAMGKLVRTSAYASLVQGLENAAKPGVAGVPKPAADVVPEMLLAIWHHPLQPRTVDVVLPFVTSTNRTTRFAATYALMRAGRSAGMSALLHALSDADPLVRETAARGLRSILVDSANLRDVARAALVAALRDSSSHVRINAVSTLGPYRDAALIAPIDALTRDPDGNVRAAAVAALGTIARGTAVSRLLAIAGDTAEHLSIRAQALASAAKTAHDTMSASTASSAGAAIAIARGWTQSAQWLQRVYGLRALAAAPYPVVAADLRRAVRDSDPRVDAEALGAIAAADTADTTHALDALYLESLASADPMVRSSAISALGRHHDAMYLSALLDAYGRAQNDRENDAAIAAVDALATLGRGDSAIARLFFLRFKRSPDPVVRSAVARSFGPAAAPWGAPLPAAEHTAAYYENIVRELVAPVLAGRSRPRAAIHSASGDIVIELAAEDAPLTVDNFFSLIVSGYFTKSSFRWHRVVPNFVLQDGDPRGDGSGGPGYAIRDEINRLRYSRGAVGMALSGPDTGGSQFFITHSPQPHLDGGYTLFGYVTSGMNIADRVVQDEAIHGIDIIR